MEKIKSKEWLKAQILAATEELRLKLEGGQKDPAREAVNAYFSKGDLKKSDVRMQALKDLCRDLGMPGKIDHLSVESLTVAFDPIKFSLMKLGSNPNNHQYSGEYFLVTRAMAGHKQNGSLGNCMPPISDAEYIAPDPKKAEELADKYIELAARINPDSEFRQYIAGLRANMSAFVDFSDLGL